MEKYVILWISNEKISAEQAEELRTFRGSEVQKIVEVPAARYGCAAPEGIPSGAEYWTRAWSAARAANQLGYKVRAIVASSIPVAARAAMFQYIEVSVDLGGLPQMPVLEPVVGPDGKHIKFVVTGSIDL